VIHQRRKQWWIIVIHHCFVTLYGHDTATARRHRGDERGGGARADTEQSDARRRLLFAIDGECAVVCTTDSFRRATPRNAFIPDKSPVSGTEHPCV
jgi:hypothetical protein